ncbi:Pycsar system effector family protein [Rhizobium sp. Rhizsp42]|uniref:Pycsar system effector family protein n=1 Tax=Rhizobium sp. Rhizsp42 TaxID=3243034 RepID=UPI0039AEACAC
MSDDLKPSSTPAPSQVRDAILNAPTLRVPEHGVSTVTSTSDVTLNEQHLAFAEFQEEYVRNYITLADTKAAWAFTIGSGVLAYLLGNDTVQAVLVKPEWTAFFVLTLTTVLLLSLSAVFSFMVVAPRLMSASGEGIVFFGAVAKHFDAVSYIKDVASHSASELAEVRLKHCFDVSRVCAKKYDSLRKAIWFGLPAISGALAVILAK